jgi:hypothetical protein
MHRLPLASLIWKTRHRCAGVVWMVKYGNLCRGEPAPAKWGAVIVWLKGSTLSINYCVNWENIASYPCVLISSCVKLAQKNISQSPGSITMLLALISTQSLVSYHLVEWTFFRNLEVWVLHFSLPRQRSQQLQQREGGMYWGSVYDGIKIYHGMASEGRSMDVYIYTD